MKKRNTQTVKEQIPKTSVYRALDIFEGVKIPWKMIIPAFLLTIVSAWIGLTTVTFSGNAVDASGNIPTEELWKYILATVLSLVFTVLSSVLSGLSSVKIQYLVRNRVWRKIIGTKSKSLDKDGGENLISRVTDDTKRASDFISYIFNITTVIIGSAMYLLQIYLISRKVAVWILVYIPVSLIFTVIYGLIRGRVMFRIQLKMAETTGYLAERTKDMNLIKTCSAKEDELRISEGLYDGMYRAQVRGGWSTLILKAGQLVLDSFAKIIPFSIGAILVANGEITVGSLVTIVGLFGSIAGVFGNLIQNFSMFKDASGALTRVRDFMDEEEEDLDRGGELVEDSREDLVFDHVDFSYTEDRQVLHDISCAVPKGKVTALVGTNGSGKSTMMKLLVRLYDPEKGTVKFGETDAAVYSLVSWRKKICLIAQDVPMMAGTIRENMCYGRKDTVSEEELKDAAVRSHVWDFVKDLPDGFDTEVAQGGSSLSGGQRQCVAIARALLSDAEYLLLDESTSNLDIHRENDVIEALREAMKNRTTIIIAHSVNAIRNADHVIVLHDGKVEASGKPQEILSMADSYLQKMMRRAGSGSAAQPV